MNPFIYSVLISFSLVATSLNAIDQDFTVEEAAFYNHHSRQQWDAAFEALKRMEFQGTEQVLDIGCGSGKITANIAGRVKEGSVLGLDVSSGMTEFAQKTYQPFYHNLSFIKEDILTFTFPSKFDLICSFSSLHWVLDHKHLLFQVSKLLNDQGYLLFTIPCIPSSEVATIVRDVIAQGPWQIYLKEYNHPRRKFSQEEYTALLKQAGFEEIEVVQMPFIYSFETKKEFVDWYASFSPVFSYIPVKMQDAFLMGLVERYLQSFPLDQEGRVIFKQDELIIKARKGASE
jgi:trans-aconitate 2-methyltransferase